MSATDSLGPHLLGRTPSPPDPRDYQLAHFLTDDPLDAALAAVLGSWEGHKTKAWAQIITARVKSLSPTPVDPAPIPDPPVPVPTPDVDWLDPAGALDQGQTGHCVGFGWAQWGNTLPIEDHFLDADGDAIYYECKNIDGEPGQENGSSVRSGAKAMQTRKRLSAYAFAQTLDEARAWVDSHGPVVFGTDWLDGMFNPDAQGFVHPTGAVAGGHCYACVGDVVSEGALLFQNSWGTNWGMPGGRFKMTYADATMLLGQQGEACAAVELPL